MLEFNLTAHNLAKKFGGGGYIFREISVSLANGGILALTGCNGSGKTTLLKILCGALRPSLGSVSLTINGSAAPGARTSSHAGFVAPYLILYEEFTPEEHLRIFSKIRGVKYDRKRAGALLKSFGLIKLRNSPIRTFSSGMKQRTKYVLAALCDPEILFLDEPTANLDADGISAALDLIFSHQKRGGGIIIATNEERDKALSKNIIRLPDHQ